MLAQVAHTTWTATRSTQHDGGVVWRLEAGLWALETAACEHYDVLDDAKRRLLQHARWHQSLGRLAVPRTGWAIEEDASAGYWLWRVGAATSSLEDQLEDARRRKDGDELEALTTLYRRAVDAVAQLAKATGVSVPLGPASFTMLGGHCLYRGVPLRGPHFEAA